MTENLPERVATPKQGVDLLAVAQQADRIKELGRTLIASGLLPDGITKPEAALLIMLKAQEIGIGPVYGLNHITVVKGKPTLSAELMRALVMRAGHKIRTVELTDESCTLEGERGDDPGHPQRYTFSMDDARQAGLAGNHSWKKYPKAMLSARATSALCRLMFPDAIAGASYTMEELGAEVNEDGEVLDTHSTVESHGEPEVEAAEVVEEAGLTAKEQDRLRFLIENTGHSIEAFEEKIGRLDEISSETGLGWIKRLGREVHDASEEAGKGSWEPDDEAADGADEIDFDDEDIEDMEQMAGGQREREPDETAPDERQDKGELPATRKQLNYLEILVEDVVDDGAAKFEEMVGKPLSELTREEASDWISRLSGSAA